VGGNARTHKILIGQTEPFALGLANIQFLFIDDLFTSASENKYKGGRDASIFAAIVNKSDQPNLNKQKEKSKTKVQERMKIPNKATRTQQREAARRRILVPFITITTTTESEKKLDGGQKTIPREKSVGGICRYKKRRTKGTADFVPVSLQQLPPKQNMTIHLKNISE
jgi:hypothetical protein